MSIRRAKSEYVLNMLRFLILNGPSSKYAIEKGTEIPYPTVLRKIQKLRGNGYIEMVKRGKRRAQIYDVKLKGVLYVYDKTKLYNEQIMLVLWRLLSRWGHMWPPENAISESVLLREYYSLMMPKVLSKVLNEINWEDFDEDAVGIKLKNYITIVPSEIPAEITTEERKEFTKQIVPVLIKSDKEYEVFRTIFLRCLRFLEEVKREIEVKIKNTKDEMKRIEKQREDIKKSLNQIARHKSLKS